MSLIIVFFIFSTNPIVFYKTPVTNKQTRIVIIYKILSLFFVAKINYNWCRKITKTDLKNLSWLVKLFVKTSDFFVVSSFNERKKNTNLQKLRSDSFRSRQWRCPWSHCSWICCMRPVWWGHLRPQKGKRKFVQRLPPILLCLTVLINPV